jgi:hypothetical protein
MTMHSEYTCPLCKVALPRDNEEICDHVADNHPEVNGRAQIHIHKKTKACLYSCTERVCRGRKVYINVWELVDHIFYKHLHPELGGNIDDTASQISAIPEEERTAAGKAARLAAERGALVGSPERETGEGGSTAPN